LSQREDQHNAIANGNPHCPKQRPAANHVIKTRAGAQSFFDNHASQSIVVFFVSTIGELNFDRCGTSLLDAKGFWERHDLTGY